MLAAPATGSVLAHSFSPSRVSLFHRRLLCSLPLRRASLFHRQLLCFARSLFLSIAHLFSIANYSGYRCCHPRHIFANYRCSRRRRTLSIHRCCHPRIFPIHRCCHCRCTLASQSATTIATTAASISYPNRIAPSVDRKSTRLNSSHQVQSRMPSSA